MKVKCRRIEEVLKIFRIFKMFHIQKKLCHAARHNPSQPSHLKCIKKKPSNKSDIKNISFINFSSPIFMFIMHDTLTELLLLFLVLLSYHFLYLFDINVWPAWWVILSYNFFSYFFSSLKKKRKILAMPKNQNSLLLLSSLSHSFSYKLSLKLIWKQ